MITPLRLGLETVLNPENLYCLERLLENMYPSV